MISGCFQRCSHPLVGSTMLDSSTFRRSTTKLSLFSPVRRSRTYESDHEYSRSLHDQLGAEQSPEKIPSDRTPVPSTVSVALHTDINRLIPSSRRRKLG